MAAVPFQENRPQVIQNSCFSIINSVRSSPLNFSIQETPFSLYLTVRKSIAKCANREECLTKSEPQESKPVENENAILKSEIEDLRDQLEVTEAKAEQRKLELEKYAAKETKHKKEVLHWLDSLDKKESEVIALKTVIKNNDHDLSNIKTEKNQLKKSLKSKEKEIHLEKIQFNQQDTIKSLRETKQNENRES